MLRERKWRILKPDLDLPETQNSKVQRRRAEYAPLAWGEQKGRWSKEHKKKDSLTFCKVPWAPSTTRSALDTVFQWLLAGATHLMAFLFLLATIPPASLRLIPMAVTPSCMVSEAAAHHIWTTFWDLQCRGIPPTESLETQGCSFFAWFFIMKMDKSDFGQERHSVPPGLVRHQMRNKRKSQKEVLVPLSFPNSHFPQPW